MRNKLIGKAIGFAITLGIFWAVAALHPLRLLGMTDTEQMFFCALLGLWWIGSTLEGIYVNLQDIAEKTPPDKVG